MFNSDNALNVNAAILRAADHFVYVAGAAVLCILAYGVRLF